MAMISVTEYAARTGKDPGNIRRMLIAGRIAGCKIGNQWALDENTEYPQDERIKTGRYRNWRRRISFNSDEAVAKAVRKMITELVGIYGTNLNRVILYGSYARGSQTEESDVDIALMLKSGCDRKMHDAMIECVSQKELECDRVLSVVDIEIDKYELWKDTLPFYKNIEKEGIVLWMKE